MKRLAIAVVVALATLAMAAETVELKRKEKVGDVKKYAVHMDFDAQGNAGEFNADVQTTVDSVDEATGVAKVRHEMKNGTAVVGGNTMSQDVPTYFVKIGGDNLPLSVEGESASPSTLRFARSLAPAFASAPIEIKEGKAKWTVDVKADPDKALSAWKQDSTYVGKETQEGEECAKVEFEMKETDGEQPITSKGTAWIRPSDGTIVKLVSDVANMPIAGYVITAKYTSTLVK